MLLQLAVTAAFPWKSWVLFEVVCVHSLTVWVFPQENRGGGIRHMGAHEDTSVLRCHQVTQGACMLTLPKAEVLQ